MHDSLSLRRPALLLAFLPLFAAGTLAQTQPQGSPQAQSSLVAQQNAKAGRAPLEAAQLPQNTVFYLAWRGAPSSSERGANNLLALWDDAEFAPVRSALAENLLKDSRKSANAKASMRTESSASAQASGEKAQLTREEIAQISSLLENPFTLAYLGEPRVSARKSAAAAPAHTWNGMFFVYDRSGKEELLTKTILRMRSSAKELPKVSAVVLGGIPALKIEQKNSTTYWAEDGKYAISASEPEVFENVVALLKGKAAAAASLAQTAAYQEAQPVAGSGLLEFFVRVPNLKEMVPASNPNAAQFQMVLGALKLEAVHSFCVHMTLDGTKTRISGAILGDASPGTPFDLWDEGLANPVSMAFVPADAVYYQESQINLLSLYKTMKRGYQASLPENQQGMGDLIDAMAQTRLGMPLQEALGLLSGEFGSLQTSAVLDPKNQTYFFGIRNKEASLRLLRALLGDRISSERSEGDTTYMKFSLGGNQGNAGVAQWNFFHLAVTPNLILASSRRETLQQAVARRATSPTLPPAVEAIRGQYPQKLNGISFVDFQKVDWQALKDKMIAESVKSARAFRESEAPAAQEPPPAWLVQFNPQVVTRHLHVSASASWKDAKGIHFDGWIE